MPIVDPSAREPSFSSVEHHGLEREVPFDCDPGARSEKWEPSSNRDWDESVNSFRNLLVQPGVMRGLRCTVRTRNNWPDRRDDDWEDHPSARTEDPSCVSLKRMVSEATCFNTTILRFKGTSTKYRLWE